MSAVFKKIIREHKLSAHLTPVFILAPELELVCTRVAEFVGEHFIGKAEPLVKEMFVDGLAAFKRVRKTGDPHVAFMQGLFGSAHMLYARRFVVRDGERCHVWSPMFEPVTVFESRHKHVPEMIDERCPENISQRSAAFQLAARALTGETFRLYFEEYDVAHAYSDSDTDAGR
ncbi:MULTISPECIES: hypothetical protein [Burkholderia]|uniref:Uncharacterized protein n=1 Tax=Burkholderia latens TaxID=488446 RepID=A0A6H9T5K0_9BURK|nr:MULTISPECIES: hypothetical protein [Burkholderia]AMU04561.1 hypothetical protein A2T82_35260 [Burkholderia cenocepacia]AMU19284.1 hypothetical protein A3203_39380 [Burkholderia cenocepacia]KAB0644580.1 hypothetical protein F7R21_01920 [Burkholderia latens]MBJ9697897.1 hypothetical protein [Burkholderia cenocepacia]MBJ9924470.1 hypothetical protein [Burkholderia cenocepacia]